ncbi:hypothetical protein Q3G72_033607 [Acer saccharum]|nr:hypothetical protein Q3G72_033607 [Acer saccharum]
MGSTDWKLPDHQKIAKNKVVGVVVLDGWGEYKDDQYNCIHTAETPFMDSLKKNAPNRWRLIKAHGSAVGLPTEDDMGNSEVGHNALGAGRSEVDMGNSEVDNKMFSLCLAWKNHMAGTPLTVIDPILRGGSTVEMIQCIAIGLLCVQEAAHRPSLAKVDLMLNSYSTSLPRLGEPASFWQNTSELEDDANEISISELVPR